MEEAIRTEDDSLVLWAESPGEARAFLSRVSRSGSMIFDRIFVAKRTGSRANWYLRGEYYRTTDDSVVDVYDEVVLAPGPVADLVQWCTCDVMISRGVRPLVVFEDTTHIVRMNLYQRFPRLARAASLAVPSVMLQGTRGLDFNMRGDRWGWYRYLQGVEAIARVHRESPTALFWYVEEATSIQAAEESAIAYVEAVVAGRRAAVDKLCWDSIALIRSELSNGVRGDVAPPIPSIEVQRDAVIVKVGARPEAKSWREKGSGQMDPYLGLILAAKYIYCYDPHGEKCRQLILRFVHLPPGFWFFADAETTALYKRLPIEFADEVEFLGEDPS